MSEVDKSKKEYVEYVIERLEVVYSYSDWHNATHGCDPKAPFEPDGELSDSVKDIVKAAARKLLA